jgi:hypothetical protein
MELGQRVLAARTESTATVSAGGAPSRQCGPFAKIIDALSDGRDCR